jgi:16S rRNA (guanine527-N7)-methyltransferase
MPPRHWLAPLDNPPMHDPRGHNPRPASSQEWATILHEGMAALKIPIPPGAIAQLVDYMLLLLKWGRLYNLTAIREPQQMLHQHLLDCLAVLPALDRHLPALGARLLDVGSGAGLPGAVLAIMRPGWHVCCVDAAAKKASFVRQVSSELSLANLAAEHARVESCELPPFDLVVSRAFASLSDFAALTRRHVGPQGCWLALKGRQPDDEMAALPADVEVFHVEQLQVPGLDAQRCLVWMRPR